MKALTNLEFIERANIVHNNEYIYDGVQYKNNHTKVVIICLLHGAFTQAPGAHLNGNGCPECARLRRAHTYEKIIEECRLTHGSKYSYEDLIYPLVNSQLNIVCSVHGPFTQRYDDHKRGQGCPQCGIESLRVKLSSNTEDFIKTSIEIHGERYDYGLVDYVNNKTLVKIICKIHGSFEKTPNAHINGQGCQICGFISKAKSKTLETVDVVNKFKVVHGDIYEYSQVEYINNNVKVDIICKVHGVFSQLVSSHFKGCGCGCVRCARDMYSKWDMVKFYRDNVDLGLDIGNLYVLKFSHKYLDIHFIKVGITKNEVNRRYSNSEYRENWDYISLIVIRAPNIDTAILENDILSKFKEYQFYIPVEVKFQGRTECLDVSVQDELLEYLSTTDLIKKTKGVKIMTFGEWLIDVNPFNKKQKIYETFVKEMRILEVSESFDSHTEITKIESNSGFKFYYFEINEKKFRVILEVVDDETGINFEQFLDGKYTTEGVSKNLTASEVMSLFGTVLYIVRKYSITEHFSIFTDNLKKFRVYNRILTGKGAKNIRYHEIMGGKVVHITFEIKDEIGWLGRAIKKFRYKAF